jgi:hypothetical protein
LSPYPPTLVEKGLSGNSIAGILPVYREERTLRQRYPTLAAGAVREGKVGKL